MLLSCFLTPPRLQHELLDQNCWTKKKCSYHSGWKPYSLKSTRVCALNHHTSNLSLCTCDRCLHLSSCSRTTDLKTGTAAERRQRRGERFRPPPTTTTPPTAPFPPPTCESTTTGLLWSRSSWLTAVGEELGAEVGGVVVVVVVCLLGGEEWVRGGRGGMEDVSSHAFIRKFS